MYRNLPPAPNGDVVQRPLTIEPRKELLHGLALRSESLVSWVNNFLLPRGMSITGSALYCRRTKRNIALDA